VDSSMTFTVPSGRMTRLGLEARSKAPHLKSGPGSAAIGQSPLVTLAPKGGPPWGSSNICSSLTGSVAPIHVLCTPPAT
jgi:hypothetical protein